MGKCGDVVGSKPSKADNMWSTSYKLWQTFEARWCCGIDTARFCTLLLCVSYSVRWYAEFFFHARVHVFFYRGRNLAATLKAKNPSSDHDIPELQTQSLTGFFSDQLIIDRIAKLNEFLDVVTKADEFQWGIRIDKDTCVYKRKSKRTDRLYSVGSRESISTLTPSMRDSMFMPMSSRASTISMDSY